MKVNIQEDFIRIIKNQALLSDEEIYGWLIGYQKNHNPHVLSIFECKKFEQQTLISAIPHAQEFQEISSVLPQGIGPIGIYHSHPFSSEVFHSHTDDSTLISLSKQFPNSISIVTNGKELNCYQIDKNDNTRAIELKYINPDVPHFLLIKVDKEIDLKIHNQILKSESTNALKIQILNKIRNWLEKIWPQLTYSYKGSAISHKEKVSEYLVDNLKNNKINLHFPNDLKLENNEELLIESAKESKSSFKKRHFKKFKLRLKAIVPIYIIEKDKSFTHFTQSIKTELISNNLLQKIYNSFIDVDSKTILLPNDIFIKFFGFYIKIMLYKNPEINGNDLKEKTYKFLLKLFSILDSMVKVDLKKDTKHHIIAILEDLKSITNQYGLTKDISKKIKSLNKII